MLFFAAAIMDNQQFESLYNAHKKQVYNLALHYVQRTDEAEDITQEVFVKVYKSYHKYNAAEASLSTWICKITVNHCLDVIKSKKSHKRNGILQSLFHAVTNEPIAEAVHFDHPGVKSEDKETMAILFTHINALPDAQKTALILSRIDNRPQREVAEIMHTSVKAVESLLQRAKQTLTKKLTDTKGI